MAALAVTGPARPAAAAGAPAYIGNGYVGTRVPADGAGYTETPVATETHVAGVHADKPDVEHGGLQRQGSVNLPGWTQLDVIVAATATPPPTPPTSARCSTFATAKSPRPRPGRRAGGRPRLVYDVALDRARQRVGLVRLRLTPSWSGNLWVRDVLGAGARLTPEGLRPVSATANATTVLLTVRTAGIGTRVAEAARLRVPPASTVAAKADTAAMTATRTATIPVRAGRTYEVTKVVGFATSLDAANAAVAARRAAGGAPKPRGHPGQERRRLGPAVARDIVVPGQPALQGRVRAAQFYLLASARPDVDWSISPGRAVGRRLQQPRLRGTPRRGCTRRCSPSTRPRRARSLTTATAPRPARGATPGGPATAGSATPGKAPSPVTR